MIGKERFGEILALTINNPPVNALGSAVRSGLAQAFIEIDGDPSVAGVVIIGTGKAFSGGADIKEFGKPPQSPQLPDLLLQIEACQVPVVAALGGVALGGGLELALSCRYRIATDAASMGLPEVKLGLIPGAGGTQRLPRIVGVKPAAEMITSGRPIDARAALNAGLIDRLTNGDLLDAAVVFVREILAGGVVRASLSEMAPPSDFDAAQLAEFENGLRKRSRGQLSPLRALEAVRASIHLPFYIGLAREREIFIECMQSDQRRGLTHVFFTERAVAKVSALEGVAPRPVSKIAILGAGTMGAGIAIACLQGGYHVSIFDANREALAAGVVRIEKTLATESEKGRMSRAAADQALSRLKTVDDISALFNSDLYIEAVVERMDVKKSVFSILDEIAKPGAVLASNTSYLNINEIAAATRRPADVIGMHFFSPAHVMRLLEIVRADKTAPDVLATAMTVGKNIDKVCVIAGVCDGFIGNRIFKKYRQQAEYIVADGAAPQDVDRAMREFGFAMGPFEVADLAGLDIGWHNRRREDATRDPNERYVAIADTLYDLGRLGQKTSAGWYRYETGDRTPHPDPIVEQLILDASRNAGVTRRKVTDDEIRDRMLFSMINEGAKILEEGIAARPLDIDVVFLNGYGFPAYRGGPMFYADMIGPKIVLDGVKRFAAEDPHAWRPSALLEKIAAQGSTFAALSPL